MGFTELFIIAVGLSMDAFAVSVCTGLTLRERLLSKALVVGLYFGLFQAAMPLIGYLAGTLFADMITTFDHWIAFLLLALIGGKMIRESFDKPECDSEGCQDSQGEEVVVMEGGEAALAEASLGPGRMLPLAIATSIDALAVGITFAFLGVDIIPAVSFIGITTLILSMVGVKVGNLFGVRFKSKAEIAGGVILILMGLKILLEHLLGW